MKKILIVLTIVAAAFFFTKSVKNVCAANWGCTDSAPGYNVCPKTGVAVPYCMQSINIKIGIQVTGVAIPTTTKFRVDLYSDVNSCSNVKCLERAQTIYIPWDGSSQANGVSDKIGCSGTLNNCWVGGHDWISVNAYFDSSTPLPTDTTCEFTSYTTLDPAKTIPGSLPSIPKIDIASGNGTDTSVVFKFNCTKPTPVTVCELPKPTVILECPSGGCTPN